MTLVTLGGDRRVTVGFRGMFGSMVLDIVVIVIEVFSVGDLSDKVGTLGWVLAWAGDGSGRFGTTAGTNSGAIDGTTLKSRRSLKLGSCPSNS